MPVLLCSGDSDHDEELRFATAAVGMCADMAYDTSTCAEGTQANTTVHVSDLSWPLRCATSVIALAHSYLYTSPEGPLTTSFPDPAHLCRSSYLRPIVASAFLPVPLTAPGIYGALLENMGSATEPADPTEIPYLLWEVSHERRIPG